jgi:hypothetical protein
MQAVCGAPCLIAALAMAAACGDWAAVGEALSSEPLCQLSVILQLLE